MKIQRRKRGTPYYFRHSKVLISGSTTFDFFKIRAGYWYWIPRAAATLGHDDHLHRRVISLRDAQDRSSPAHKHKLHVRQFPILKPHVYRSQLTQAFPTYFSSPSKSRTTNYADLESLGASCTLYLEVDLMGPYPTGTIPRRQDGHPGSGFLI